MHWPKPISPADAPPLYSNISGQSACLPPLAFRFTACPDKTLRYVALGDSIVTGSVTYWSDIESYADYFYIHLQKYHKGRAEVVFQNLAHDGDGTHELLKSLYEDKKLVEAVRRAGLITLCIGGNNIMCAAKIPGFTQIDWEKAEAGLALFEAEWPLLVKRLKAIKSPDTGVIANTLYNPYDREPPEGFEKDAGLHEKAAPFIARINDCIHAAEGEDWLTADVFKAFDRYSLSKMADITYMYPPRIRHLFRNPHPTRRGQLIITELCIAAYEGLALPDFGYFAMEKA